MIYNGGGRVEMKILYALLVSYSIILVRPVNLDKYIK
jgi:hypothetical protein